MIIPINPIRHNTITPAQRATKGVCIAPLYPVSATQADTPQVEHLTTGVPLEVNLL